MPKRTFIIVVLIAGLFTAACESAAEKAREAASQVPPKTAVKPDGSIHLTPEQAQANKFQLAVVASQELTATITVLGRVTARAGGESKVFSPFPGRLLARPAQIPRLGESVSKGQLIAEVEQIFTAAESAQIGGTAAQFGATSASYQSAIEQAQQDVAFQEVEAERARKLYQDGLLPLNQLQNAEFNVRQAQAKLAGASRTKAEYEAARKQQVNAPRRAPIRAPLSGTVISVDITPGQQIDSAKPLLTIVDLSRIWVEAAVYETQLPAVRRARRAEITTPANPGRIYRGQLVTISGVVDPLNRTITVIFAVDNPDAGLKIGMTTEARIPTGPGAAALVIPASAVLSEADQQIVYVESEPGVFRRRVITTGERSGGDIAVTAGLSAGEKVVSVGAESLRSEALKSQIPVPQ